jgi:succinate dehydrogenase / fumarate reductase flavoprotein subunit/L-aspartate oxidase
MQVPQPWLTPDEKEALTRQHHPDYKEAAYRAIRLGPNAGEQTVHELADLLEAESPVSQSDVPFSPAHRPDHRVDVLVIGGGGAGTTAALTAAAVGASVLLATKLRLGDSNTVMAEGGMQVAVSPEDSPVRHYLDTLRGGQMKNDPALLARLVEEGPEAARWLMEMGVLFDREDDGNLSLRAGGGSSKPRLLRCKDYTGLEMMRVLKDELLNRQLNVLEFSPILELITDGAGQCTGAILKNLDTQRYIVIQAKTVILATGGIGRLHIQGFPTSNHYGATADGLPIAYRAGARLTLQETFQYHPTGAVFPEPMAGILVTEAIRSVGAHLVNADGERFINELETRDAVAAAVIRECHEGRGVVTTSGRHGVWLDMPMVDLLNGEGTLAHRFPNMGRQYRRHQIDIQKEPVLIYPTLHYQNGGVKIDVDGESGVRNLFVAGEASGGIHGRNRLMGNSLLDIIVFGRRAGRAAAGRAVHIPFGDLTLQHLNAFHQARKEAGVDSPAVSPILFPNYVKRAAA